MLSLRSLCRHSSCYEGLWHVRLTVLPAEVIQQVVAKTDRVRLFVEELTEMMLESGPLWEEADHNELAGPLPSLAIPTTLHDSLMARLDRLAAVKQVAQLGATIGRSFSYELVRAVSSLDDIILQRTLAHLVEAELVSQQGVPPQASYLFKHALIQEAAYQSLLRCTCQQYHQHIARVLAEQFPETAETQPELLAHHYTQARLIAQAIPYWQRAGQRAIQRSAHLEAISHLTQGLQWLKILPKSTERPSKNSPCTSLWACPSWPPRATPPTRWRKSTAKPDSCASRSGTPRSSSECCGDCRSFISCGQIYRRLATQGSSSSAWPTECIIQPSSAEIYGWFTEGFGMADLQEAKALLAVS
jgi:hypothetical protein